MVFPQVATLAAPIIVAEWSPVLIPLHATQAAVVESTVAIA